MIFLPGAAASIVLLIKCLYAIWQAFSAFSQREFYLPDAGGCHRNNRFPEKSPEIRANQDYHL
jgi:hypothetical protein